MQMNYIKDDGGRSKYFNRRALGDCVVRACAIGTGLDYLDIFKELCEIAIEVGELPNTSPVYDKLLTRHGFTKNKPPRSSNGKQIPIRKWVPDAPRGNIVAHTRKHLVAIIDNVQRDTFLDERCVNSFYHK